MTAAAGESFAQSNECHEKEAEAVHPNSDVVGPDGSGGTRAIRARRFRSKRERRGSRSCPSADGKTLLGGEFTTISGQIRKRIARLNPDGTLDTAFDPNANNAEFLATRPLRITIC